MYVNISTLVMVIAGMATVGTFLFLVQQAHTRRIERLIKDSVEHLAEVLTAKLESKDAVARMSERLARVEGQVDGGNKAPSSN